MPTSMGNWMVDANLRTMSLKLEDGMPKALVHEGFLKVVKRLLPRIKKWVNGYALGLIGAIPPDWTLIFTGHCLGGALAILAATLAEVEGWHHQTVAGECL